MAPAGEWILRRHSSELKKNKILLRTVHIDGELYHPTEPLDSYSVFHVLDLNTGEFTTLDHLLIDDDLYGYMVVLDSTIYVLGRLDIDPSDLPTHGDSIHIHQGVSYLDLSKPQIGWKGASVMSPEQLFGDCVPYGGKMYAFRGSYGSCVCEVFDPENNHWSRIKSPPIPPVGCEITRPVMADPTNKRILVCFNQISTLFAYYPVDDRWEPVVEGFGAWSNGHRLDVAFGDGIIYVHDSGNNGKIRAYDVASKQWLNVTLSSTDFESFLCPRYAFLNYLGNGLLCFVGFPVIRGTHKSRTSIYVVQLKVELKNDPKEVLVTSVSSKTYDPLDCIFYVRQCLPI